MAHDVVTKLAINLEYLGHCITIDGYFTLIPLFIELVLKGIYATGIVTWTNHIGLPTFLKNTKKFKRVEQGHMQWLMYEDRVILYVMWKDKCPVLLLPTYATPI